jgi:hypothetical protein
MSWNYEDVNNPCLSAHIELMAALIIIFGINYIFDVVDLTALTASRFDACATTFCLRVFKLIRFH